MRALLLGYTFFMPFNAVTYHAKNTPVHGLDARVKILLMLVYSLALFFVHTWKGLAAMALLWAAAAVLSKLDVVRAARQLVPIGFVLAVMLLANAFAFDVRAAPAPVGPASAGVFANMEPWSLVGSFGFVPAGFARGCFYVVRVVLLVGASLVLTTTTTSTQITNALNSFLSPLGRFGLPVRDVSTIASIALRFIPITVYQFQQVRSAQAARGAQFDTGSLATRLRGWQTVFIPLFVGLFRRASDLAGAMDARAYGLTEAAQLDSPGFGGSDVLVLVCGCALCVAVAFVG